MNDTEPQTRESIEEALEEARLADHLREAIEASNITDCLKLEDLHDEDASNVLLECILKLQEPGLALDLVRKARP